MKYYVCAICDSTNSATRIHCQNCGTVPAMYSLTRKPVNYVGTEVVRARGAVLAAQHESRIYFRTVELDYYAEV